MGDDGFVAQPSDAVEAHSAVVDLGRQVEQRRRLGAGQPGASQRLGDEGEYGFGSERPVGQRAGAAPDCFGGPARELLVADRFGELLES